MSATEAARFAAFVEKWRPSAAAERANKDSFLNDLCAVLGVPGPDPTTGDAKRDHFVFEKAVQVSTETGKTTKFIDLYKRGSFVLEAKQGSESNTGKLGTAKRDTPTWNVAMNAAFGQAIDYAAALDQPPPFIIVTDIGYCFDIYASFDGSPRYRPFPNALGHRFFLTRLAERADTLRSIFLDPLSLDPSKVAIEVTREVAAHLADLTRRLEKAGHAPQSVADFLMRCIFTMFAEDVGLLPEEMFTTELREHWIKSPRSFTQGVENLWRAMNDGLVFGFVGKLLHFNGGLFKSPAALPLEKGDLQVLLEAARCSWNKVEPAIFGTLFEGALDKKERHSLGAHFTPRAFVERLVRPTLEEPLREEWDATQSKVRAFASNNKIKDAKAEVRTFMKRLSEVRVLDPACGSGNFLYLALDMMKAIEDEAFALLLALEGGQTELCLDASEVTPKQFLGIEMNPRAKAIAELVLWIGYLQWHFRSKHRTGKPREPVLSDYKNIECRDAVLGYDTAELRRDANGKPVTRWDGESLKKHPRTQEMVPDERFTVPVYDYSNPRPAAWPAAQFIVGNPPFIGNWRMRTALGDGYTEALRAAYADVPETADFVLYWLEKCASLVAAGQVRRTGLITTNTVTQPLARQILQRHMSSLRPLSLAFAIPDHPWIDSKNGADVRIAMSVLESGISQGKLVTVSREVKRLDGEPQVELTESVGFLNADFTTGANVGVTKSLRANAEITCPGVKLHGAGFIVDAAQAKRLGLGTVKGLEKHIVPYLNGKDFTARTRSAFVIDLFGLSEAEVMTRFPDVYQWVYERVKPERDSNNRSTYRKLWWIFGEPRALFRPALAGLPRYIATPETAKHRVFQFLDATVLPDNKLVATASDDPFILGILSSNIHCAWALAAGGKLGVGNDPVYVKTTCFEKFPFPNCSAAIAATVSALAESLDEHRKMVLKRSPNLTITGLYNVLEKARADAPLSAVELAIYGDGLVAILRKIHDELDEAVSTAYQWPRELRTDEILGRLVALNAERAEEERAGLVRWLRPEFQQASGAHGEPAEVESSDSERPGIAKTKPPKSPGIAETLAVTGKRKSKRAAH